VTGTPCCARGRARSENRPDGGRVQLHSTVLHRANPLALFPKKRDNLLYPLCHDAHRKKVRPQTIKPHFAPIKNDRVLLADDHPVIGRHCGLSKQSPESRSRRGSQRRKKPFARPRTVSRYHSDGHRHAAHQRLAVTETLRKELPQIKVLILSPVNSATFVPRILQSGARGYFAKDAPTEELVKAIETVQRGDNFFWRRGRSIALQANDGEMQPPTAAS